MQLHSLKSQRILRGCDNDKQFYCDAPCHQEGSTDLHKTFSAKFKQKFLLGKRMWSSLISWGNIVKKNNVYPNGLKEKFQKTVSKTFNRETCKCVSSIREALKFQYHNADPSHCHGFPWSYPSNAFPMCSSYMKFQEEKWPFSESNQCCPSGMKVKNEFLKLGNPLSCSCSKPKNCYSGTYEEILEIDNTEIREVENDCVAPFVWMVKDIQCESISQEADTSTNNISEDYKLNGLLDFVESDWKTFHLIAEKLLEDLLEEQRSRSMRSLTSRNNGCSIPSSDIQHSCGLLHLNKCLTIQETNYSESLSSPLSGPSKTLSLIDLKDSFEEHSHDETIPAESEELQDINEEWKDAAMALTRIEDAYENIKIIIRSITLFSSSSLMKNNEISQIYVEYTFLGYGGQDLETFSAKPILMGNNYHITFNFCRTFAVDAKTHFIQRRLLTLMLFPGDIDHLLRFVVVNVCSSDTDSHFKDYADIGYADLDLMQMMKVELDLFNEKIPVFSVDGKEHLGYLNIIVTGIQVLRCISSGSK